MRQLSFLPSAAREYGGESSRGKRKTTRPYSPKLPLHVTLKASQARGKLSMIRSRWEIQEVLTRTSQRHRIRIYRFANVGTHLHLLIQAKTRREMQAFLREFAGVVAVMVTGAIKGQPKKFWDHLAHSKIVTWGRQFNHAMSYVLLNVMESVGLRDRSLLARLERDGCLILGP